MPQSETNRQPSLNTDGALPVESAAAHSSERMPNPMPVKRQPSSNLTLPRTPLIGRDHELAVVQQLLLQDHIGVLTLTGPGGIGKTRLAVQVAANSLDHFVDGVYFVSLAPISDPDLVSATLAQTLGVREAPGRPLQESLQECLRNRQLLLVLDNFEQILPAASVVSALLAACRRLKVLVTSRATLHLYGEQEFPVSPLALPDAKRLGTVDQESPTRLAEFAAIDLFCQRARAVKPDFTLTPDNAAAVAKICIGLDGLPLALELAAARIKFFSPAALLARLEQRLTLLTGGAHDLPTRQRTLRDEIAWSYDLLRPDEQKLFRRLAVFVGGFTLAAAQSVGKADGDGVLDAVDPIASLVDHNLVKALESNGDEARFGMLETIREYGLEQLEANGEAETIRWRHADFFLALAEATEPLLRQEQAKGLARLMADHANLRAALAWSVVAANASELALRLTTSLREFWTFIGAWREGHQWFAAALARTTAADRTLVKAHALIGAGCTAVMLGDPSTANLRIEEGLALAREYGSQRFMAIALTNLSFLAQDNHELAIARFREALAIGRAIGDQYQVAESFALFQELK
ncbi:MAG: NB-ARC domain-containing protein [Caldilineaceae bacterium]